MKKITYFQQYIDDSGCTREAVRTFKTSDANQIEFYTKALKGTSYAGDYVKTYSIEEC